MATERGRSFWQRLFTRREEKVEALRAEVDRFARFESVRDAADPAAAREVRKSTGAFIQGAIKEKRFETAAFTLAAKGKPEDAEQLGDQAMKQGKYGQAIQIFSRTGNPAKLALANEMAARDCLKRGGSRKTASARIYAAIQAYGRLLASQRTERVPIMKKLSVLCDDLLGLLEGTDDHLAAADTALYQAQLCMHLAAFSTAQDVFVADPEVFHGAKKKALDRAARAREGYRRHVEANALNPDTPEGKRIVEKIKSVRIVIERCSALPE
ncbi:MAG: hypothetical protein FJ087_01060 [Deltaproteobacteria bacterium]|nr:hypothetical protein [Deltaproteobacteria bacterium]